jgi:hypothetical protein
MRYWLWVLGMELQVFVSASWRIKSLPLSAWKLISVYTKGEDKMGFRQDPKQYS